MARNETKTRFTASLIAGLLLIPASAVGAFTIVSNATAEPTVAPAAPPTTAPSVPTEAPATTVTTTTVPTTEVVVAEPPQASDADLAAACGPEGLALVEAEAAELLDDVQQAALDALRQICDGAGLALPGPPAPPPEVVTVTVGDAVTSVVGGAMQTSYDDDHDEYEDDDEYEDHDEDDEHDDDEHDDDEHEYEDHDDGHEDDDHDEDEDD